MNTIMFLALALLCSSVGGAKTTMLRAPKDVDLKVEQVKSEIDNEKADFKHLRMVADIEDAEAHKEEAAAHNDELDGEAIEKVATSTAKTELDRATKYLPIGEDRDAAFAAAHGEEAQKFTDAKQMEDVAAKEKKDAADTEKDVTRMRQDAAAIEAIVMPAKAVVPQDDTQTLEALGKGLKTIHNLRALFTKDKTDSPKDGSEKFANGALSEELSNKDSQVWSTIETMIEATQDAKKSMKGKSKSEREHVMKSLEDKLDNKAKVLSNVTDDVSKKQMEQDEEYLLGLLLLHQNNWNMEKQLNATQQFMHNSPVLQNLFKHHDASKPLAPQLAAMMDVKNKAGVAKVEKSSAEMKAAAAKVAAAAAKAAPALARLAKEEQKEKTAKAAAAAKVQPKAAKKRIGKAASAVARTLFIQLANSITNRDCPYCAAQCVDKCHTAGKPYVQCLTDCADAGK